MGPCIAAVNGGDFAIDHRLGRIQLHEFGLTREPLGGKPEGVDAGPVVAEGAFTRV
jgi:anti-sigma-K factor RskA